MEINVVKIHGEELYSLKSYSLDIIKTIHFNTRTLASIAREMFMSEKLMFLLRLSLYCYYLFQITESRIYLFGTFRNIYLTYTK